MRYKVVSCGQSSHNILYNDQLMNKNSFMVICSRELADDIARIMEAALNAGGAPAEQTNNSSSHEMPSFVEFDDWYKSNACASKRDIYDWFARHFGH